MNLTNWLKAFRLPFLTATIIPVALGSVIAWNHGGGFNWFLFFLTTLGISFLHIGTNLANDYFDHKSGNDDINKTPTPFSGGSRVIQEGSIKAKSVFLAALGFFALGSIVGLYINRLLDSNFILILGVVGVFFGFFYTAAPFKIGYYGFGELVVGFCFGPLVVVGAYYVQAQTFNTSAALASLPVGILITMVLYINEFLDYAADKASKKNTLVVVLGKKKALSLYHSLLVFTYLVIIALLVFEVLPLICFIAFLSAPLAFKAFKISKENFNKINELIPANALTIALHLAVGVLLIIGFILDKVIA